MRVKTARALDKTVILAATLFLAARTYQYPSQLFWDNLLRDRSYILVIMLAVLGIFGAFTPIETITARSKSESSLTIRRQVLNSLGRILDIGKGISPQLGLNDLGLHIWRKRRTLRHPIQGVLSRVATYRVGTDPINRQFSPTKGVGVVGLCWKHDQEQAYNVEQLAGRVHTPDEFNNYRDQHGGDALMNLDWAEFNRLKHRGAVFAYPIRNGRNRFIGCLSVDASHGFDTLNQPALRNEMSLLSLVIGQAGFETV